MANIKWQFGDAFAVNKHSVKYVRCSCGYMMEEYGKHIDIEKVYLCTNDDCHLAWRPIPEWNTGAQAIKIKLPDGKFVSLQLWYTTSEKASLVHTSGRELHQA